MGLPLPGLRKDYSFYPVIVSIFKVILVIPTIAIHYDLQHCVKGTKVTECDAWGCDDCSGGTIVGDDQLQRSLWPKRPAACLCLQSGRLCLIRPSHLSPTLRSLVFHASPLLTIVYAFITKVGAQKESPS